jgi:hypothetical protein
VAQFAKGTPKPPNSGRAKGTPNKGTERWRRLISERRQKTIIDNIMDGAGGGDRHAQALALRYLMPPRPKTNPTPTTIPDPKTIEATREALAKLTVGILSGEIDLEAAAAAAPLLKAIADSIVGVDLQKLLDELKAKAK